MTVAFLICIAFTGMSCAETGVLLIDAPADGKPCMTHAPELFRPGVMTCWVVEGVAT